MGWRRENEVKNALGQFESKIFFPTRSFDVQHMVGSWLIRSMVHSGINQVLSDETINLFFIDFCVQCIDGR